MILITGASGQLGTELVKLCTARGIAFKAVARPEFDFEKPDTIGACFATARPDIVINAAAYTAVDKAETDQDAAKAGNHTGPLALAKLCARTGIPFIHVSTDYVFDGNKGAPYVETDRPSPTGVYGATKRAGEETILMLNAQTVILRTSWVYAGHGKNFARTMLTYGRKNPVMRVVADQRGTPTAARDLAAAILAIVDKINETGWQPKYQGIFHATGAGETTWHGFATAIFEEAAKLGYKAPEVAAIATADWPTPTRRPPDSRLDCTKLAQTFGVRLPDWRETLPGVVKDLLTLEG
jgi:dTDP-4-dehydrorhamnose reductase